MTFEELSTLMTQIEAILYSRPFTPLSVDPNDLGALTLFDRSTINSLPSPNLLEVNLNRLSRYQHIEHMQQQFWRRVPNEYLSELQPRTK